jgi:hypothetical protein
MDGRWRRRTHTLKHADLRDTTAKCKLWILPESQFKQIKYKKSFLIQMRKSGCRLRCELDKILLIFLRKEIIL